MIGVCVCGNYGNDGFPGSRLPTFSNKVAVVLSFKVG